MTINDAEVEAFLGIPYAIPPVGEYRFMPPVPIGKWANVKKTTRQEIQYYLK